MLTIWTPHLSYEMQTACPGPLHMGADGTGTALTRPVSHVRGPILTSARRPLTRSHAPPNRQYRYRGTPTPSRAAALGLAPPCPPGPSVLHTPVASASTGTAGPVVQRPLPLFGAAAEGSRPHAGAAQTHKEQHGIACSGGELFGTHQLTFQGVTLVSSLPSLTPSSTRTSRAPPSRSR